MCWWQVLMIDISGWIQWIYKFKFMFAVLNNNTLTIMLSNYRLPMIWLLVVIVLCRWHILEFLDDQELLLRWVFDLLWESSGHDFYKKTKKPSKIPNTTCTGSLLYWVKLKKSKIKRILKNSFINWKLTFSYDFLFTNLMIISM